MFVSESLVRAIAADRAREIERNGRTAQLLDGMEPAAAAPSPRRADAAARMARTRPTRGTDRTCEPA